MPVETWKYKSQSGPDDRPGNHPLHLAPIPAAGEHLPSGKPMGAENGPETAFRALVGNLAQRRADPPSGPSG